MTLVILVSAANQLIVAFSFVGWLMEIGLIIVALMVVGALIPAEIHVPFFR